MEPTDEGTNQQKVTLHTTTWQWNKFVLPALTQIRPERKKKVRLIQEEWRKSVSQRLSKGRKMRTISSPSTLNEFSCWRGFPQKLWLTILLLMKMMMGSEGCLIRENEGGKLLGQTPLNISGKRTVSAEKLSDDYGWANIGGLPFQRQYKRKRKSCIIMIIN